MITAANIRPSNGIIPKEKDVVLTRDYLKLRMEYKDGELYWKRYKNNREGWNARNAGKRAGSYIEKTGRVTVVINRKHYSHHRLVWIYHNGTINTLDHVKRHSEDGERRDRIENLYLVKRGGGK